MLSRRCPGLNGRESSPGLDRGSALEPQTVYTGAFGESMTGVPATPKMHFRNGAVAFSYLATLLLEGRS
jgi:hypothetical protein